MEDIVEVNYLDIEDKGYDQLIETVLEKCFKEEKIDNTKLYVSVTLTNPENIRRINKEHRNIDRQTDVLSFPFFEKDELENGKFTEFRDVLGDIVISIEQVERQALEYGHSFERELSYMVVHGFFHIMGYDHTNEEEKCEMRAKEENILNSLNITRNL
ncbi:MAG: rRNA maturation RNase YbeY [Clostridia bacterium]|nr:rRNA maturation RNase YbeY [Clostridia bacterium]